MKRMGDLLTWAEGRRFAVVTQTISAIITAVLIIVLFSSMSEFEGRNYYGRYDDEINKCWLFIGMGFICLASEISTACAIYNQKISVYENIVNGVARKTMWSNRPVEIEYKDIRDVSSTAALVKIRTATDEIHFCVNDSEYVAGQIRYQWNKLSRQSQKQEGKD